MKTAIKTFCVCTAAVLMLYGSVGAKVKSKNLGKTNQTTASIAIDPDGFPHVAYQGTDYSLYHARFDGRKWVRELVDTNQYYENSMAIDSQGRIHIVYGAERIKQSGATYPLMYARYDGNAWHVNELPVNGFNPRIALDATGRPRVLFRDNSSYRYAEFNGTSWEFEDTGLPWSWYSDGFALDAEGHAHISYSVNYSGSFYATNTSGSWETTQLSTGNAGATALALDTAGRPRVVIADGGALIYYSFDGANWSQETIVDFNDADPGITATIESYIAMALDNEDRARIMIGLYLSSGNRYGNAAVLVFDNGVVWNGLLIDKKSPGLYPDMVLDAQDTAHVTYCGYLKNNNKGTKTKWARIALSELIGD